MIDININNINVGDIFSTKGALRKKLGFKKATKPDLIKYQDREIGRYLEYKKTGKISRGKETNEIIITEIYDITKEKIDNRKNNKGHGRFCYILKDLLLSSIYETYNEGYKGYYRVNELMSPYGFNLIPNEEYIKKEINDFYANVYKRKLENEFITKLKTACKSLEKDYNFTWRYTYLLDNNIIVNEKDYIEMIKVFGKARLETCKFFGYAPNNFDILMAKNEEAPKFYSRYMKERFYEIGLNHEKRQKIFIFEWNDNISILESKNNLNHDNGFKDYIEKQGILFDLFKNRMEIITEKLIDLYSKIKDEKDIILNFHDIHNEFWDWGNDYEYNYLKHCS